MAYEDSQTIALGGPAPTIEEVILAFFGGVPRWVDGLMAMRNAIVRPLGLKTGPIGKEALAPPFSVGHSIGLFRIIALSDTEVVFGEDDRHLDFRVALRLEKGDAPAVTVSTQVTPHNRLGRAYLAVVLPAHRIIAPTVARGMARRLNSRNG